LILFGRRVYSIVLGNVSESLERDDFGCGHIFDPFEKKVHNLPQTLTEKQEEKNIQNTFGLFKRK
jgi:hypothetical protein